MRQQHLVAGAIIAVILAIIGWMTISNKDTSSPVMPKRTAEQEQASRQNTILRPELIEQLERRSAGVLLKSSGEGTLPSGARWRYRNAWPNPDLKIRGATGETLAVQASGLGQGGELRLVGRKRVGSKQTAPLLREALNDRRVNIVRLRGKWHLTSRYIVARSITVKGRHLNIYGLFLASSCRGPNSVQAAVRKACQATVRPGN